MVNLRALVVVLVAGMVLGGTAYATHRFQVKRNARSLLAQADQAEEEGRLTQAADYVWQYLGMTPSDNEALARYTLLTEKEATTQSAKVRVLGLCEEVLRRDETRTDVRRVAARLAADLGLVKEGRIHLDELSKDSPNDPALLLLRARLETWGREFETAAEAYAQVVERTPADLAAWRDYLAVCSEGLKDADGAEEVVEEMIAANPKSPEARAIAARYFLRTGAVEKADQHLRLALEGSQGKNEDVLLLAADVAGLRGQTEQARQHLRRGLRLHPNSVAMRLAAARLEARARRTAKALALLAPLRRALPERLEQRWAVGTLLADLGEFAGAEEVLRKLDSPEGEWARGLLEAQLLLRKKDLGKARRQLEQLRSVAMPAALGRPVDLLLAECYLALGSPDQAAVAARRVLAAVPNSSAGRARLAEALAASGKNDEAVQESRRLAAREPAQGVHLARLLLGRQLRLPEKDRDWKELEKVLDGVPPEQRRDTEMVLLRAEMLLARGQADEAHKLAETARERAPKEAEPWLFLAELARRKGGAKEYLAVLDQAEQRAGRRVEWALARVRQWTLAGDDAARKQLRELARDLGRWPEGERERLSASLGLALAHLGDQVSAKKLWRDTARQRPGDLTSRLLLLEGATSADEARRLAGEIDQLEGRGRGPLGAYAHAVAAWLAGRSGDRAALAEARRHLERATALRPSWAQVHALQGDIELHEGRREVAVKKYQAAIERGDTRLRVWRQLAQLLFDLRRYGEASALLRRVPEQDRLKGSLGQLSATLVLVDPNEAGDAQARRKQALEKALEVVHAGSGSYRDHLWLGQLAWMAGEPQEAEKALRKARDMAPEEPSTWVALVSLLAQVARMAGEPREAEKALRKARKEVAKAEKVLKKGPDLLALMACYEIVGQNEDAEKVAGLALREHPGEPGMMWEAAASHTRQGRVEQAEKLWRQILEPGTKAPESLVRRARRALAVHVALKLTYPAYQEALALIEQNLEGSNAVEDRRVKALVLATQPAQRAEAIRMFEGLSPLAPTMPSLMQRLLARLYELDGRWPQARACLLAVARAEDRNPRDIRLAALTLLRHGEREEARRFFDQLGSAAKAAPEGIELRARLLYAEDKKKRAVRLLEEYGGDRADRLGPVALVLEDLGKNEAAEKLLRRLAADPKHPEGLVLLGRHLVQRKRTTEALRLCERAWGRATDEQVATLSLMVVRTGLVSEEQRRQATEKVRTALVRSRKPVTLLLVLASLEDAAARYDEAIVLCRRAQELEPGNVLALNNQAYLLTLKHGKHEEALKLIDAAIEAAGPAAELLNTRGLIHLGAGRAEQAVKDLLAAVKQAPAPARYFHLAQAQYAAGEQRAARATLLRGRGKGLKEEVLHPLERPAFRTLSGELGVQ
jgi:tetratricopeptide (TPR) repeat protein